MNRSKTPMMLVVYNQNMPLHKNNAGERAVLEMNSAYRLMKSGVVTVIAGPLTSDQVASMGGIEAWLTKNKEKIHVPERVRKELRAHPGLPGNSPDDVRPEEWDDVDWGSGVQPKKPANARQ